jgi:filamentous hemagglutinin family protein
MKKGLAVLLCLCIAFVPAIANARAGTKIQGFYKDLLPPLPKPKLPNATATEPKLDLTVAPKKRLAETSSTHLVSDSSTTPCSAEDCPQAMSNPPSGYQNQNISSITYDTNPKGGGTVDVVQSAAQAIQNWSSFNVGAKWTVNFEQKSSSWVILNRIWDLNPSTIFGKISALGGVYLINQNGILFGQGSQVDLHTLIASSLNISDSDFMNGLLNFSAQDYQAQLYGPTTQYLSASVTNQGTITTDNLGSVFLLAPNVTNDTTGAISTQIGQIGLAAGASISLIQNGNWKAANVDSNTAGNAINNGSMTTNTGLIGMYGKDVDQNGQIVAITSLKVGGEIDLMASDSATTGAGSITSTPISTSTETADQSYLNFAPGTINITGLSSSTASLRIVCNGTVLAPSGTVTMQAQNSVTLGSGSSIDVSGLWIDKPASANTTQIQLNSVELTDYPDQKSGILHGATITVNNLLGSSIGNISGYLTTQQETAQERSLTGGTIKISTPYTGNVIVNQGASLDFSGGGTNYSGGNVTTTALISGNKAYDISNAPETLKYTGITSVTNYVGSYVEGADAGTLSLQAGKIVLNGNISGAATTGVYQTATSELTDIMGNQKTLGLQAPAGGTLIIGAQPGSSSLVESLDFVVDSVVLYGPIDQVPSNSNATYLSAQKLSAAGLSSLEIAANTTLTVMADADISLNSWTRFFPSTQSYQRATVSLAARSIDFQGQINVPSGNVNLTVEDNVTAFTSVDNSSTIDNSRYVRLPLGSFPGIILEEGSQISAAGQRIDNSAAATASTAPFTYVGGGAVSIEDESYYGEGVIAKAGSVIDVSGGYGISQSGVVTGGNAGSLTIQGAGTVQNGAGISLDANCDLKGYSLQGSKGGSITLNAQGIAVVNSSAQPGAQQYQDVGLVLDQDRLDNTGFTNIKLQSVDNTTIESGVSVSLSLVKLASPVPGGNLNEGGLVTVSQDFIGSSSFSVTAGHLLDRPTTGLLQFNPPFYNPITNPTIQVLENASVSVAPGGSILLNAPVSSVTVSGDLNAPAGTVGITAGLLTLLGEISARGYNQPAQKPIMPGLPLNYTPLSGGTVTLSAATVSTGASSKIDVSGSSSVTTWLLNGSGAPVAETVASNPGSITISGNQLSLNGNLIGQAQLAGLQGGTLSIKKLDNLTPYILDGSDLQKYVAGGFDALYFKSDNALVFQDFSGPIKVGRSLELDAPCFTYNGSTSEDINLSAPWIQITNSYYPGTAQNSNGTAHLTLAGDWIDASGTFFFSGFTNVTLQAEHDLRLSDFEYVLAGSVSVWGGLMETSADLTLQADRIYPSMDAASSPSNFTIKSGSTITIEGSDTHNSSPIYSAGGFLTIDADGQGGIVMDGGFLEAPMGQITLNAPNGRVLLSGGTISTYGTIAVSYGSYAPPKTGTTEDLFWTIQNKADPDSDYGTLVTSAPQSSVTISGNEVKTMPGSVINISGSGGGSIFAYGFQQGIQGSIDPLQTKGISLIGQQLWNNRYVIVPTGDYSLPGQAVYLEGAPGLKAGVYSLLPEQYAFLPGAMVVTDTGATVTSGTKEASADGYPIVAGYLTYMGTSIRPSLMQAFEVQPASYLLTQGDFNTAKFVAGNAGSVSLAGNTAIVTGTILANPLNGYQGGTISLSGTDAYIESETTQIPANPAAGTLYVAASALVGFNEISIGNLSSSNGAVTQSIEMEQGAVLNATQVVLSAQKAITLDSGAQIVTVDSQGNGSTSLISPTGLLTMQQNSLIHASDTVTMTIGQLNFQGGLEIDHGTLNLTGQNVYLIPQQGTSPSNPDPLGLYLSNAFWSNFANFNDVNISASGGYSDGSVRGLVGFLGGMTLSANKVFTINAAEIEGLHTADNGSVVINAPTISLLNRGGGAPPSPNLPNSGSFTLQNANYIYIGEGAFLNGLTPSNPNPNGLLIDGFATVNFSAKNDITFQGTGSLVTGAGNLNFASARLTTSYYEDANTAYTAANFTVSAPNAAVDISPPTGGAAAPGSTVTPGGTLELDANSIDVSGVIQMASATLTLNATGSGGVTLSGTAQILDGGIIQAITVNGQTTYSCSPGGSVYLNSAGGPVNIAAGALVDVSGVQEDNYAYAQQNKISYNVFTDPNDIGVNAGLISIYSSGSASIQGTLKGAAGYWKSYDGSSVINGARGSFVLNTEDLSDNSASDKGFSALNTILKNGGFTEEIDISLRGGTSGQTLTIGDNIVANNFNLTTDNWSIDFSGKIDSISVGGGGTIQFNSGGNLTLEAASKIISPGATVFLNTADGNPNQTGNLYFYGQIDVTGASGQPAGTVHFSAPWSSYYGTNANSLTGTITGAKQILAEGVLYGGNSGVSTQQVTYTANNGNIYSANIGNWLTGIQGFMQVAPTPAGLSPTLINCGGTAQFVPGLEVRSSGDLTLQDSWDLTAGGWDSLGPGFLTLRATGNLNINQNLVDHPTSSYKALSSTTAKPSWGMTLVAGADLSSSDSSTVVKQTGQFTSGIDDLTIAGGATVYTESAPLRLAAGGDLIAYSPPRTPQGLGPGYMINTTMSYNIATYSGRISVMAGHDVMLKDGAVIQSAVGDIDVHAGNDLILWDSNNVNYLGAIRTTGEYQGVLPSGNISKYWGYGGGGNISVFVEGNVTGETVQTSGNIGNGWDSYYLKPPINLIVQGWSANYVDSVGQGISSTEGLATMAGGNLTVFAGGSFTCQAGTFAGVSANGTFASNSVGNLTIFSGSDMQGRFLIANGSGELHSMGNFGNSHADLPIEMFADTVNVTAQGDIDIGAIVNPTVTRPLSSSNPSVPWDLTYASFSASGVATYASVSLTSVNGNVTLSGQDNYYGNDGNNNNLSLLPPAVAITAGGNINLLQDFTLAPYASGNLSLIAGGSIDGQSGNNRSTIYMSEMSDGLPGQPYNDVYGPHSADPRVAGDTGSDSTGLLHINDPTSVLLSANGNIADLILDLPKKANIEAGGNISDIYYEGYNNSSNDVTTIKAGNDLTFSSQQINTGETGIFEGGPGALVVEAGGSIDLGTSNGIQVVGNGLNAQLPAIGSTLVVVSGYTGNFSDTAADAGLFQTLQVKGTQYSNANAAGNAAQAQQIVAETRADTIVPFLSAMSPTKGSGNILMTSSQISIQSGPTIAYTFASSNARDAYFSAHLAALTQGLYILNGSQDQEWNGTAWVNVTQGILVFTKGDLNVGKSSVYGNISNNGIYTVAGGDIDVLANGDVNVFESRILTSRGGDITVWSDTGNINAGRGSKTAVTTPPEQTITIGSQTVTAFSPPSVGSGIRAVTYAPGFGLPTPPAGNIYLFAPQGVIDAGEAGIAGNNVILGAVQVLNANNISFSGSSVGVPVASQGLSGLSALSGVGSVTQAMQTQEAAISGAAGNKLAQSISATSDAFTASLEVKVLSVFDVDPSESSWEKTDN